MEVVIGSPPWRAAPAVVGVRPGRGLRRRRAVVRSVPTVVLWFVP